MLNMILLIICFNLLYHYLKTKLKLIYVSYKISCEKKAQCDDNTRLGSCKKH